MATTAPTTEAHPPQPQQQSQVQQPATGGAAASAAAAEAMVAGEGDAGAEGGETSNGLDQQQQDKTAGATSEAPQEEGAAAPTADLDTSRLPTRKDVSLRDFLTKMDDYAPIIPDAVTSYYMTRAGLPPPPQTDQRLARLLALATQKFVADIAADAYQYSRIRASNSASANNPMGNLGAAAGFPVPGQPGVGMAPGGPGGPGGGAAGGVANKDQSGGKGGGPLGIQRPGFGGGGQGGSQNRTVLTMEDLGMAVGEYGVNVKRSEFYR